jgi:hypothetical protein
MGSRDDSVPTNGITDNALAWLSGEFQRRVSTSIALIRREDGKIACTATGLAGQVIFTQTMKEYWGNGKVDDCEFWNCNPYGLECPSNSHLVVPKNKDTHCNISIVAQNGNYTMSFDLPGMLYWLFLRVEERSIVERDSHNRISARSSHAFRFGYLVRPIADEWMRAFAQLCKRLWPDLEYRGPGYQLLLSHDVDFPSRYAHCSARHFLRAVAKDILHQTSPSSALNGLKIRALARHAELLSDADPYNTFNWIMDRSEEVNCTSTFYFMMGGSHSLDAGYDARHPTIRALMRIIHKRGHQIGLHPSYRCIDDPFLMQAEAERLRKIADDEQIIQSDWGVRMHFYRSEYPALWHRIEALGFSHDATMGYADHIGFRAGTAAKYRAFDTQGDHEIEIDVHPLAAMEGTLLSEAYMGVGNDEEILDHVQNVALSCRNLDVPLSLLWHNSELYDDKLRSLYQEVLKMTSAKIESGNSSHQDSTMIGPDKLNASKSAPT